MTQGKVDDHSPPAVTPLPYRSAKHGMTSSTRPQANTHQQGPPDITAAQLSVDGLEARSVSFRGTAHQLFGGPRQDAYAMATTAAWLVIAVSDGIGSCEHSHHGANAAVNAVAAAVDSDNLDPQDGVEVLRIAAAAAAAAADRLEAPTTAVSATLTVAAVERTAQDDGARHAIVHIVGDSPAMLLDPTDASWTYLTSPQDGPSNVVNSWVPDRHRDFTSFGTTIPSGSVLILASDGFTTPLGDGTGLLGADLAARWSHAPRDLFPFMVDLSFNAYHDDKTVVAVWTPALRARASQDHEDPTDSDADV